jgi:hypothetical protein
LLCAEAASGIDFFSRTFQVGLDLEAMFTAAEAVIVRRTEIYFIHAGAEINTARLGDDIAAFADRDFGFAFTLPVELDAHFPGPNPLAFGHRVRGHVQVLNL